MESLDAIRAVLESRPEVRLAYVFGSAARGESRPRSDVDVAVLTAGDPPAEALDRLTAAMERATRRRVDLVDLSLAPPVLAHEVIATGRLLVCRDEGERQAVEARATLRYLDTAYLRRLQHDYLRTWAEAYRARPA